MAIPSLYSLSFGVLQLDQVYFQHDFEMREPERILNCLFESETFTPGSMALVIF